MSANTIQGVGMQLLTIPGVKSFKLVERKKDSTYKLTLKLVNKTYLPIVMEQVWGATSGVIVKKLIFEL